MVAWTTARAGLGLVALWSALAVQTHAAEECAFKTDGKGVTYDLSQLQTNGPFYIDGGDNPCTYDKVEQNYTYFFSFCNPIEKLPSPTCATKDGFVMQLDFATTNPDYQCVSAGKTKGPYSFVDSENPAAGFQVSYTDGDLCHTQNVNRQTTIKAYCEESSSPLEYGNPMVIEQGEKSCKYEIIWRSPFACPKECPVSGSQICGGQGHCKYDTESQAARCFCNSGWGGPDCSTDLDTGVDGTIIGLVATVFIFAVILCAAMAILYRQVRMYRSDADNYLKLRGQELVTNDSI